MIPPKMSPVTPPEAFCKVVLAVLAPMPRPPQSLWDALEPVFGLIEYKGDFLPFKNTEYYRDEFGEGLHRGFIAFRGVVGPERLPELKHAAARLEAMWIKEGKRLYNLDIGYMDPDKLVLASFKRGPCKLYLNDGVYADLLLRYSQGHFDSLPWSFTDFQDGRYEPSLLCIREKLKADLRRGRNRRNGEAE